MGIAILIASLLGLAGAIGGGIAVGSQVRYPRGFRVQLLGRSGSVVVDPEAGATLDAMGVSAAEIAACLTAAVSEWAGFKGVDAGRELNSFCVYFVGPTEWAKISPAPSVVAFLGRFNQGIGSGVPVAFIRADENHNNKLSNVIHEALHALSNKATLSQTENYGHQGEVWTRIEPAARKRVGVV